MSTAGEVRRTPEEYLAFERRVEHRHEYLDGQILAMAGASGAHNRISVNLTRRLDEQLEKGPCQVFHSELRVCVGNGNAYVYPDIAIACEGVQFADAELDALLNPTAVIEILSPSSPGRVPCAGPANLDPGE